MNIATTLPLPASPTQRSPRLSIPLALRRRIDAARARWRRQRVQRDTAEMLRALDDRTLLDLGLHRCEIPGVAAELAGAVAPSRVLALALHGLRC